MPPETTTRYRWVGDHAQEFSVGDKRIMLGPGDFVELGSDDAQSTDNQTWIENGLLMNAPAPKGGE